MEELGSMGNAFLPKKISIDILSHLPAESVLQCRRVCKTWLTFLRDSEFADMHLQRSRRQLMQLDDDDDDDHNINGGAAKVGLGFLFSTSWKDGVGGRVQLYYGEYYADNNIDHHKQFSYKALKKINHPNSNKHVVVGSCNGLICVAETPYCSHYYRGNFTYLDPVYVYNPFTGEFVYLSRFDKLLKGYTVMNGFGYHPSSNEYKVVRIYYFPNQPSIGQVQVYTIGGSDGWRNRGEIKYKLQRSSLSLGGILANGALHWLSIDREIVAFDLADEEFRVVTPPTCFLPAVDFSGKHCFHLRELGGCLCVVHQVSGDRVDIWALKKTKAHSTYNMKEQECHSRTWSREFSIPWAGQYDDEYDPFALTKSGEVLLCYNRNTLSCYDPKTATSKTLMHHNSVKGVNFIIAIPHMNSFVSLEAL
ncbi:F-box domain [Macleaya cordata]|uniref:F-box domain n=1 Tax=Macleaya cordata TaxID=56857 RepID=A0A200QBS5_MACCD|nr:F-box domain [Macleaya cordata]